jgi:hypothetical protein
MPAFRCSIMPQACIGVEVSANLNVRDAISNTLPAGGVSAWRTPDIDARALPPSASAGKRGLRGHPSYTSHDAHGRSTVERTLPPADLAQDRQP